MAPVKSAEQHGLVRSVSKHTDVSISEWDEIFDSQQVINKVGYHRNDHV